MNTRLKGRKNELRAKKLLEAEGYLVYQVKGSTKWNKDVDIFGLFDLISIRNGFIKLIQIKTNRKPTMRPFKEFYDNYCFYKSNNGKVGVGNISVEVWVWYDRKGFKKWRIGTNEQSSK